MKKIILSLIFSFMLYLFVPAIAEDFAFLEDLTPVQKQKLSQIYYSFKQESNSLEMRIVNYQDKLNKIKTIEDKSAEQINLLSSAYARNIKTLQAQQEQLKLNMEESYKAVMTPNQYKQYLAQQLQTENAFSDFLRK